MNDFFENFKSEQSENKNLGVVKDHPVRIVRYEKSDSRANFDGTVKEREPKYADATPQLICVFVSAEGKGGIVHRYNGAGYYKFAELTEKQIQAANIINVDGYACVKKKEGYIRIEHPEKTKACRDILSNMFNAFGLPEGSGLPSLDIAIQEQRIALLSTVAEEYNDRTQIKVQRLKKPASYVIN